MTENGIRTLRMTSAFGLALVLSLAITGSTFGATHQLRYTIEFNQDELIISEVQGYDFIRFHAGDHLTDLGKPALPVRSLKIALPDGYSLQSASVESMARVNLAGSFNLLPAQPPVAPDGSYDDIEFVEPDKATYESIDPYPTGRMRFFGQSDLAGQGMATVEICPFEYIPATGEVVLHTSVTVVLECDEGYVCGDYLPDRISQKNERAYTEMLERMVINPSDVQTRTSMYGSSKASMLPPGDPFDHVIITNASDAPFWEPLADWHTKKGVRDTVVTTAYIYDNYSGADVQDMIRNFVIDAHDNWGTMYFLMGGEHAEVPFKYVSYVDDNIPSDEHYADFDDDWEMEVYVGRVTADNSTQIARFIEKLIHYETSPPAGDYILNATMVGMDLTTAFDPPYYTLTAGEDLKEYIDTSYIPSRFNVTKIYDSQAGSHLSDFINALNAGQNLINHCDHSYTTIMGCGDRNHGDYISNYSVDALTNDGALSVIFSLGCHPNEMDYNDCIAEHFVIYNSLQAGVAFTGNTRSGWFIVGDPLSLSNRLDYMWWEGLFEANAYRLGETLAYAKNNSPSSSAHWKYVQWTLNLLGEPAMPVWTDTPAEFLVSHPDLLPVLPTDFTVHVQDAGGDLADAYVCLWRDGEIYETGYTDGSGEITFSVVPLSAGDMFVTVTKQNFVPYQGTTEFTEENLAPVCLTPGDTMILLCDIEQVCVPVNCSDLDGNLSSGPTLVDGPGEIIGGSWCYTPTGAETVNITVACEDSAGALCESSFEVEFRVNSAPSCTPPNDTTIVQCVPEQVMLFIGTSDPDLNMAGCEVISGPGSVQFGSWVYTPQQGNETANVTIRCYDACGEFCEVSFQVQFAVNQAPICEGPDDTTIVQCEATPVSLPISSYDPEGEAVECEIITGPGEIIDGYWNFSPSDDGTVHVIVRCTDPCGAGCNNSFLVTFAVNDPPSCSGLFDTTVVQCSASEVSIPVPVDDPDDNIASMSIVDGPGVLDGHDWVYTPSGAEAVDVTVRCIDDCGLQCDKTMQITFDVNSAPVCASADDVVFSMTEPALITVPIEASDVDDNLVGCAVVEGPGEIVGGNWEYYPERSDTADVTVVCSDECDVSCETNFQVVVYMYSCGDANSSGAVDIDDVVYLIGYIFSGGLAPIPVEAGDANCSGEVDIDDVVYLISYIFSGGPAPCSECE